MATPVGLGDVFDVYDLLKTKARRYSKDELQLLISYCVGNDGLYLERDDDGISTLVMCFTTRNPFPGRLPCPSPDQGGSFLYVEFAWSRTGDTTPLKLAKEACDAHPGAEFMAFYRGKKLCTHRIRRSGDNGQGQTESGRQLRHEEIPRLGGSIHPLRGDEEQHGTGG